MRIKTITYACGHKVKYGVGGDSPWTLQGLKRGENRACYDCRSVYATSNLYVGNFNVEINHTKGRLYIHNVKTGCTIVRIYGLGNSYEGRRMTDMAITPDGKFISSQNVTDQLLEAMVSGKTNTKPSRSKRPNRRGDHR